MPSILKATLLIKSFEALMLFGITPGCSISYLLHEGMKSQKSGSFPGAIEGATDATALRCDGNYSSFQAEVPF
jgi:hypothetical protein